MQLTGIIIIVVIGICVVAFILSIPYLQEWTRKRTIAKVAENLGYEFNWKKPLPRQVPHQGWFASTGWTLSRYWVAHKDDAEEYYLIEPLIIQYPAGVAPTIVAIYCERRQLPTFGMSPRGIVSKFFQWINAGDGEDEVMVSPDFRKKYQLKTTAQEAVSKLFDDRVVKFLINTEPSIFVDGYQSWMFIYQDQSTRLTPKRIPVLIDQARQLSKLLN